MTAASSSHGAVSINADGTLVFTPAANFNGPTTLGYTISDGHGGTAGATVYVMVTPLEEFSQWMSGFNLSAGPVEDSDGDSILSLIHI